MREREKENQRYMKPVKEEKKIKGENNIYVQDKNGEQTKVAKKSKKTTKTR